MRILLDTGAMAGMSSTLRTISQDVDGLAWHVGADAALVMPPHVAAEVAASVGAAAGGMRRVGDRYAAIAGDLQRRGAFAEASEAAAGASLGGLLLRGRLGPGGPIPRSSLRGLFGATSWARSLWQRAADLAGGDPVVISNALHDGWDVANFVSSNSHISQLNRFDVPIIKGANFSLFRYAGTGFAILSGVQNLATSWQDVRGENWIGREVTVQASVGTDIAFTRFPLLAASNFLSLGSLRADAAAVYTSLGESLSHATDGAFAAARKDIASHNYLGLGVDVPAAFGKGMVQGANHGLNTWAKDVDDGRYGGLLGGISHAENHLIDAHYDQISHPVRTAGRALSAAGHGVSGFVKHLFK
jgi:hypothetical protein